MGTERTGVANYLTLYSISAISWCFAHEGFVKYHYHSAKWFSKSFSAANTFKRFYAC
jgi:energy-converting hydrogenase Eha subunit G